MTKQLPTQGDNSHVAQYMGPAKQAQTRAELQQALGDINATPVGCHKTDRYLAQSHTHIDPIDKVVMSQHFAVEEVMRAYSSKDQ
ncbi:TPA: hypothetical protein ACSP74_001822 [Aeromonas veronii]|uniref:hypothetical protein n=1 Tax=Aeromonas veronii TaxID=654 RepID=UPI0003615AED